MRSSQVQAGTARPLRSAGGRLLREMLKGEMPDLDFAEKCCIFALAQKEEVAHWRLPPLLYPPPDRETAVFGKIRKPAVRFQVLCSFN